MDVSLATQPTGPVTVTVVSADPAAATVTPATLTFTTTNWRTAQAITVTGTDDTNTTDDTATITLTAMSADSDYGSLTAAVAVTVTDDDSVDVLTVTCDAAAQTITIQWPELEADRVQVFGDTGVRVGWNTAVTGSRVVVSTVGLASVERWETDQWDQQWGDQPDDWSSASSWATFWPDGDQLTVYVWPHHDSGDAFPCP